MICNYCVERDVKLYSVSHVRNVCILLLFDVYTIMMMINLCVIHLIAR